MIDNGEWSAYELFLANLLDLDVNKLKLCRYIDPDGVCGYYGLEAQGFTSEADDLASIGLQAWIARAKMTDTYYTK